MIRCIAAIDSTRGLANDHGIPWHGKVPHETEYYHEKLKTGLILLGYGTYIELAKPMDDRLNYVATTNNDQLREGFEPVSDARAFLREADQDVWNIGGAQLFASTLDLADELYLTQVAGDFGCTKFFPEYEGDFTKVSKSEPITENGITYRFTVWKRLPKQG